MKAVGGEQSEFQQGIQEREEGLQDLRQAVQSLKSSAQAAVEDSKRLFAELIHSIERRRSEVIALIRDQEKAAVSRAEGLLEQLEQEIAEFRRIYTEVEQLSHTEDQIYFLQNCPSLCAHPGPGDIPTIIPQVSFEAAVKSVSELKKQLKDVCKRGFLKITESVKEADVIQIPKPTVRDEFLQYYCHLTLDPNTAYSQLSLSKGNKEVTRVKESQSYPDHPARFDYWEQVLCREGLSGRHYWEVEWSGKGDVYIAVSYEGIMRKGWGHNTLLGYNDKSWSLWCTPSKCYFYHNKIYITLPVAPSSRIGVYLDHRAGTLSFYSVSDTMALLHRVQTTFTQPLYPGFYANTAGSTIKLCTVGSH
ncbi:tripartite motif-containing protein 16-like [Anguilla rostrata]|uniref:tripartite motif-containing protein 16-like n=1 Tax=Anguilla rostrata TaxID=7938 RepID=UPI0030D232CB